MYSGRGCSQGPPALVCRKFEASERSTRGPLRRERTTHDRELRGQIVAELQVESVLRVAVAKKEPARRE